MRQTEMIEWVPAIEMTNAMRNKWYLTTNEFGGVEMHWMCARGHFVDENFRAVPRGHIVAFAELPRGYRADKEGNHA